jgi:hypothetical protein
LPFSGSESGRLRIAPTRNRKSLRARKEPKPGRTMNLRVQDQPGGKRDFGRRAATGQEGASAPDRSGRTEPSGTGAANRRDPGFRSMACQGGTRCFGIWNPFRGMRASARRKLSRKRDFGSEPPSGEPPGLRPWWGASRVNRATPSGIERTPEIANGAPGSMRTRASLFGSGEL